MDRKQLTSALAVAVAVVGLWFLVVQFLERQYPQLFAPAPVPSAQVDQTPPTTTQPTTQTEAAITTQPAVASGSGPTTAPAAVVSSPATPTPMVRAAGATGAPGPVIIGTAGPTSGYAMQVTLTPTGAGVESVLLNRFKSTDRKNPYVFQQPIYPDHPETSPLATRSVVINGTTVDISQVAWTAVPGDSTRARFVLPLVDSSGKPLATLTKTYSITPASTGPSTPQGYELSVDMGVKDQSGAPLSVQTTFNGPTTPPKEIDRGADRAIDIAYATAPGELAVTQHLIEEFKPSAPEMDLTKDKSDQPAVWVGATSAYFEALLLPLPAPASSPKSAYTIHAKSLDPDDPDRLVQLTFSTDAVTLSPGQTLSMPTSVFLGPKQRDLLTSPYYSAYPRGYDQSLVIHGSYCGFLQFNWLVWTLVAMLRVFHFITRDWGLSIICLVVIVRLVLHPITKRSQVNMMKMGKMGPEIERLKKKYGDDKDALNKAMMDVYKSQGLAPILGCLPMFLQMPIWIALWGALQSTFELRQAPFLWGFTWIHDLAKPDALLSWPTVALPFVGWHVSSLNLLPVLMGVVFFLQQKYTPKPPAATPEQEQQQKMMQWMSLLFPVFLYNGPSGLNLYILTSTTWGIFENRIIRKHIKDREEADKAGRVFVETKPTRGSKQTKKEPPKDDGKKSRFSRWIADLQDRAEQVRTEAERKKRRET